jgi:hypothetical protein
MTPPATPTLEQALDAFCAQSNLSPNTLRTYRHAVDHFLTFLETSEMAHRTSLGGPEARQRRPSRLGASDEDVNLLVWFVNYLGRDVELTGRRALPSGSALLEPATVRLYGQAVISWFRFMVDELILPESYPASSAMRKASRLLRTYVPASEARDGAPEPAEGLETLFHAFDDHASDPEASPKEAKRQELESLRNRAMLWLTAAHA